MTEIPYEMVISQEVKRNPFSFYDKLRTDEPLVRVQYPDGKYYWLFTRYNDALAMFKDPRVVNDFHAVASFTELPTGLKEPSPGGKPHPFDQVNGHLLYKDIPDHTRLRGLVSQAFTPRSIERLREKIQQTVDELLDDVQDKGSIDLIAEFAFPLSFKVLSELLGVPHEMWEQFRRWINAIVVTSDDLEANLEAAINYLKILIVKKRANPMDDLISRLVQAENAEGKLSEKELLSMLYLIFIAGYETTVNLISGGTIVLLQQPDQLRRLKEDPALIASTVEELLRYTSPTEATLIRWAREDIEMYGQVIKKGDMVRSSLLSANYDPTQFANPDVLDIGRQDNKHLAFGKGIHYCLGAPLARLEGQIVFHTLFTRFPNLQLERDPGEIQWNPSSVFHGVANLRVLLAKLPK